MALTCGWPKGIHTEVHLVKVYDAPLVNSAAEPRVAVLTLCPRHGPAVVEDSDDLAWPDPARPTA